MNKGYGWKNAATNTLNDSNCIFQIGSNTKPFTAAIILKLEEQGKLSLADNLNKYLPDFPNGNEITIENLITHTSGIPTYTADETDTIAWKPVTKEFILNTFKNSRLEFKPGAKHKYSNSGYFLLGMIIEKVTGNTYEQIVREMIFEPLHMQHSGFDFIHLNDTLKATGYSILNSDKQIPVHLLDSTVAYSAGAMYSTTDDLYRWSKVIAGKEFLSLKTWRKALTPFKENFGYGWFIDSMNGKSVIGHTGGITGFVSHFVYFPNEDVTIILLSNSRDENAPGVALPAQDLSAIIFNKPYSLYQQKKEVAITDSVMSSYIGTYALTGTPKRTMRLAKEDGQPVLIIDSKTTLHMAFQSNTKFQLKELPGVDGEFSLSNGKVIKMVISQNGIFEWLKVK